jgi:hypothetical protein
VYAEIVVAGARLPGASQVAKSDWIEVKPIQNPTGLIEASLKHRLGIGELSTVLLGKELRAEIALMNDLRARRLAKNNGLEVRGTVGVANCFLARVIWPTCGRPFETSLPTMSISPANSLKNGCGISASAALIFEWTSRAGRKEDTGPIMPASKSK